MSGLTRDEIRELPVGAQVWWLCGATTVTAERIDAVTWRSNLGGEYDNYDMSTGAPVYLLPAGVVPVHAPGDTAGMWEPGLSPEAAEAFLYVAANMPPAATDADTDIPWIVYTDEGEFDAVVSAVDEETALRRAVEDVGCCPGCTVERDVGSHKDGSPLDCNGTPDALPAVDACTP